MALYPSINWQFAVFPQAERPLFIERFLNDPVANTIAVIVLVGMLVSLISVAFSFVQEGQDRPSRWSKWSVPILALLGTGIAAYLSFVEVSGVQAVCGPTGNCNAVQQSVYSHLFGVIPVGLLGLIGYLVIFLCWLVGEYGPVRVKKAMPISIWGMALFGVVFSIYLTFLEPFVIGSTCMWCISSTIVITLILWASLQPAKDALNPGEDEWDEEADEDLESGDTVGNPG
jgi:uncharacterized membrane protein